LNCPQDDGIVVVEVRERCLAVARAFQALHDRLGIQAMSELQQLVADTGQQWRDEVIALVAERFDRRLVEQMSALRLDMAKEFGAVRVEIAESCADVRSEISRECAAVRNEMARECAAVRSEMAREFAVVRGEMATGLASTRAELLKWSFVFWIGQFAAVTGMMAFLLRTIR
jgi:hypothetical protein